jgi:hypothetical protein
MFLVLILILSSIFDFVTGNLFELLGGIGAVFMALVAWFARKYLLPFLEIGRRRQYANYIAIIADEVTDDLVRRYPNESWVKYFDEAVDKIISICGIDIEVARRAASAAMSRK